MLLMVTDVDDHDNSCEDNGVDDDDDDDDGNDDVET